MTKPVEHVSEGPRGATALPIAGGPGFLPIQAGDLRLMGWSLVESTGAAPAAFTWVDGDQANAFTKGVGALAAGASHTVWLAGRGVQIETALSLLVTAGAVRGCVWVIDN